ncbi:hypothetical protein [Winogradskyella sp. R77965]|uniref:hypothetical protein n=1 Tax=Winogradskyella sp. R77965 TaxID=3093872 RepID=UPI0037DCE55F
MKNLFLLICSLVLATSTTPIDFVNHEQLLLDAHRAKEKNETKIALSLYEKAFQIHDDNTTGEYLDAAVCAAELNNRISCSKWIIEAIIKNKASKKYIAKFSKNRLYQESVTKILIDYNLYLEKFYENIENPMVYFKIQKLINRDQFVRKANDLYLGITDEQKAIAYEKVLEYQKPEDSLMRKKLWAILRPDLKGEYKEYNETVRINADSLNIVELIKITKEHGWNKQAWILLWHQRDTYGKKNWVWDYFKPFINREIEEGRIKPSFWAIFEDLSSIQKTGTSIYGYHPGKVNSETVNKMREKIGLPLLTETEIKHRNNNPFGGRTF